ncbi:MAG: type II toxin-antitoxin system Phd/YefM family antitoxin [Acholeplasmataceae bacterium]
MKKIVPSSDLRNKYPEISKLAKEEQQPIYITVNGRGDTVLLSQYVYEKQLAELELLKSLAIAEDDVNKGHLMDSEVVFSSVKKKIK